MGLVDALRGKQKERPVVFVSITAPMFIWCCFRDILSLRHERNELRVTDAVIYKGIAELNSAEDTNVPQGALLANRMSQVRREFYRPQEGVVPVSFFQPKERDTAVFEWFNPEQFGREYLETVFLLGLCTIWLENRDLMTSYRRLKRGLSIPPP